MATSTIKKNTKHYTETTSIKFTAQNTCVVCAGKRLTSLIKLPELPVTGLYSSFNQPLKTCNADQDFCICEGCGHAQLRNIVDPAILYGGEYSFRTSESTSAKGGTDIFYKFVRSFIGEQKIRSVIDVGCNDLYLLNLLKSNAKELVGIDPIWKNKTKTIKDSQIKLVGEFVEKVNINQHLKSKPELVLCRHTLEHIADPKKVIKQLLEWGDDNTLYVFEFPSIEPLLEGFRFDRIFHQHLQYFSLNSFTNLLNSLNAKLIDSMVNYHHWGALLVAFKKDTSQQQVHFDPKYSNINRLKDEIIQRYMYFKNQLAQINTLNQVNSGREIVGYGASNMVPILFYHLGPRNQIKVIYDDNKTKNNLKYTNLDVIIKSPELDEIQDKYVMITALDHVRTLVKRAAEFQPKHIIYPLNIF